MDKRYKILLTKSGCKHCNSCEYNKGSLAVIIATIQLIRNKFPDSEISTYIQLSPNISNCYNIKIIGDHNLRKYGNYSIWNSIGMSFNVLRCITWRAISYCKIDLPILIKNDTLDAINECDVVVDLSLDAYGDEYGLIPLWETSKEIFISKLLKKKFIIFAQSMGPFNNPISSFIAKRALNNVSLISVRENVSYSYVKQLGITKPPIYITADPAFLLEPCADVALTLLETIDKSNPIIGIAISKMKQARMRKSTNFASLVLYLLPDALLEKILPSLTKSVYAKNKASDFNWLIEIIDELIKKYNATILLIPHIISQEPSGLSSFGDDRNAIHEIYNNVPLYDKCRVIPILGTYSSEELKGIIGICDCFIGEKMHANIGALSQCIPTLALAYSHKFYGIMDSLGQKSYVLNTTNNRDILKSFDELWINREKIKCELTQKIKEIKALSASNGVLIEKVLNE